jgi:uncharacterized protein (TIGR03437 family)
LIFGARLFAFTLVAASLLHAARVVVDFESLSDSDVITTQFAGLTFSNAQTLTAGFSLDEIEFPAHSGKNAVSDRGGPITIGFSALISDFSGYFTHLKPITVTAFDGAGNHLATTSSSKNNAAISGDGSVPNELLSLTGTNIAKIVITADPAGNSLVADDLSYTILSGTGGPVVNSLVSAASFATGAIATGSIASLFGVNLSSQTLSATTLPLPTSLGGVSASIAGLDAALYYVSPNQVNLQLPAGLPPGPATLVVKANGVMATLTVQIAAVSPGIFLIGTYAAAINVSDSRVNGPTAGAAPGSYVELFITGAGDVSPAVPTGLPAPASPLSFVVAPVTATVGGQMANVVFAGLTPGLVALVQVNLQVPNGLPDGDYPVIVSVGGVPGNSALLRITNP